MGKKINIGRKRIGRIIRRKRNIWRKTKIGRSIGRKRNIWRKRKIGKQRKVDREGRER